MARRVAWTGWLATVVGRHLSPAFHGTLVGADAPLNLLELLAGFVSFLFAFMTISGIAHSASQSMRERALPVWYRASATLLPVIVLFLSPLTLVRGGAEQSRILLSVLSALMAALAAREGLRVPRTRAIAVVLGLTSISALLHLWAQLMAIRAGAEALYRMGSAARWAATGASAFDLGALLVTLLWLALKNRESATWSTRVALFGGILLSWGAQRGVHEGAAVWEQVARRSLEAALPLPPGFVWLPLQFLAEATAPLLALVALFTRGQNPAVLSCFTLILLARPATDIPLSALTLTLASLCVALTARDDRGLWAVLGSNKASSRAPIASQMP